MKNCNGCVILVDGVKHLHVGAHVIFSEGGPYTVQDDDSPVPSVAVISCESSNFITLVLPYGFPNMPALGVLKRITNKHALKRMDKRRLRIVYQDAVKAFEAEVSRGSIVRDFMGRWHSMKYESDIQQWDVN